MLLKKSLALLLCTCLTLSLCLFALPKTARADQYKIWIGGVELNSSNKYYLNGGGAGSAGNYNAYFEPGDETSTLYLNNLVLQNSTAEITPPNSNWSIVCYGIFANLIHLTIDLSGDNFVSTSDGAVYDNFAVYIRNGDASSLTFTGGGTLTATAGSATEGNSSYGLYANNFIEVKGGCKITGISSVGTFSSGITTDIKLTVSGAGSTLTGIGGTNRLNRSCGVHLNGSDALIEALNGGSISGKGGNNPSKDSVGVYLTNGSISVSGAGSSLSGVGGTSNTGSYGVIACNTPGSEDISISVSSGGRLSVTGGAIGAGPSFGIYTHNNISVNGGAFIADGGAEAEKGCGIVSVFDSAVITVNGGELLSRGRAGAVLYKADGDPLNPLSDGHVTLGDGIPAVTGSSYDGPGDAVYTSGNAIPSAVKYFKAPETLPDPPVPVPSSAGVAGVVGSSYSGNAYTGGYSVDANGNIIYTIQADCNKLVSLLLDGKLLVRDKDYTVVCGSTIITLYKSTTDALPSGAHTLRAQFTDGRYDGSFTTPLSSALTTAAAPSVPATGGMGVGYALLALAAVLALRKRRG